ncbi:hypothetical protein GCM10007857_75490 [Bradyrhizobium iriomotense]|uniref:Uncharacterized protein n=1 Tax=Bradyrhizobium iriomotense TaxID=441950 RepID=A0ABQ6BF88_9BRAD|nr:hypothetical protein GCM10007857_75490 [Bradyrhizobium iriomotense]
MTARLGSAIFRSMLDIFDILEEPKFWFALASGLAPIVVAIIILWLRR